VTAALSALDERFPGDAGRYHRARLLAARAAVEHASGEPDDACASVVRSWEEAGACAADVLRSQWRTLRPVLWEALARGAVSPAAVLPALQDAFPDGRALVALVDHPDGGVRRAALLAALAAGHPAVLARLDALRRDGDERVAAAASAAGERLRARPPLLRFELLGGFVVKRGGWTLDEASWKRPMAARVVRFLLIRGPGFVPEDELFEAFWSDRDADSARQHLAVAVSRARKVLDLPGASASVIEVRERTYRVRLLERDSVDSAEFEAAAAAALAERHGARRAALERAAALWTGEPLPEDRYAPWTFTWRDGLIELYGSVLGALAEIYERSGEPHEAIRTARAVLEVDPLNEQAHRRLMIAYARTGRTSYALRQFLECRRALVVEAGVEPSAQTSRLQSRILAGEAV
jgi:DNA-binding SARP family transcriptional activator